MSLNIGIDVDVDVDVNADLVMDVDIRIVVDLIVTSNRNDLYISTATTPRRQIEFNTDEASLKRTKVTKPIQNGNTSSLKRTSNQTRNGFFSGTLSSPFFQFLQVLKAVLENRIRRRQITIHR